ncbi:Uncharacterised protein [Slackia heliotrinireducens]|uniref:Uncharacterized protein n=1 Tax=Slackia heliotrinireducens (strain ATCC 29202 / DSM 20476 / NCTC 11029 / RHS 1) TaxID=471855 RepID=C7N642_SLAHD|nr:hypothetical protein [Slackia heliotrinireducens]ACV22377.1 hypothetical protein Shel_13540 [Slackia heliotrinireducens DSM 20476]VEH00667.1 Uncharacterised protein [Slackia heliotrinireducens]
MSLFNKTEDVRPTIVAPDHLMQENEPDQAGPKPGTPEREPDEKDRADLEHASVKAGTPTRNGREYLPDPFDDDDVETVVARNVPPEVMHLFEDSIELTWTMTDWNRFSTSGTHLGAIAVGEGPDCMINTRLTMSYSGWDNALEFYVNTHFTVPCGFARENAEKFLRHTNQMKILGEYKLIDDTVYFVSSRPVYLEEFTSDNLGHFDDFCKALIVEASTTVATIAAVACGCDPWDDRLY